MIELQGVTKCFGGKTAVSDLTLSIPSGELFVLLGVNGAGKTTTLKMVSGLLRTTEGRIRVCGIDVHRESLKAKALLSYIPDQPYLYDKLTGREFLHFIGEMYRLPAEQTAREAARLVELFGMGEYIDELCETYSHGMKQRVVVSATLLHQPRVIVVDEPLVGLDPESSRLVKSILKEKAREGITLLVSTHVLSIAEEVADRIGILHEGRLIACDDLQGLRGKRGQDETLEELFLHIVRGEASGTQ